jgi:hypothetical protein
MLPGGGTEPPTRDELHQLEARIDARLQQVNAKLLLHDGQIAKVGGAVDQVDRRVDVMSERMESRFRSLNERFNSVESRLDMSDVRQQSTHNLVVDLVGEVRANRRQHARLTMAGVAGSSLASATLSIGAMVVLI